MTQARIPEQMTAVVLDSYSGPEALRVEQRPVPKPGADEVLVRVAAAPINPSDLAVLSGRYGFKSQPPLIPGGEGAGTVVAVGPGPMGRFFLGKRVACLWGGSQNGVWSEYAVVSARGGALPLHDTVDLEQGSMAATNPLTASAFIEIAKQGEHRSIALTAAAGSLGQMVNRLGRSAGVEIINIVRRNQQVQLLKKQGAGIVLNSSENGFDEQLREVCHQQDTHLAFDAVAGSLTGRLLAALPQRSKVTIFGGLSFEPVQAAPDRFIFEKKSVDGFWLGPWMASKNLVRILLLWRRAQRLMSKEFRSQVRARYPFTEAKTAVQDYVSHMTGGKILLTPN